MRTIKKGKLHLDCETLLQLDRMSLERARGGAAAGNGNGRTLFPASYIPVSCQPCTVPV